MAKSILLFVFAKDMPSSIKRVSGSLIASLYVTPIALSETSRHIHLTLIFTQGSFYRTASEQVGDKTAF